MSESKPADVGVDNHKEALSIWLDAFRWVAAFAVLLSHVSHRVFLRFSEVPHGHRSPLYYVVGGVASFGEPAVIVFFVLSGFLVGGGSLRRYRQTGHFDASDYLIARLSRLWTVLIPVFLATLLLNTLGHDVLGAAPMYDLTGIDTNWAQLHSLETLFCNVFFMQTALCFHYGGNGALWSLFNEFWYYIAWPFVMLAIWSRGSVLYRLAMLAIALIGLILLSNIQWVGANIGAYFSIWLVGVVAADRDRPLIRMPIALCVALFVASLIVWRLSSDSEVLGTRFLKPFLFDITIATIFANLIMLMKASRRLFYPPFRKVHQPIAGFSFTLYCLHTPVINALAAFLLVTYGVGWHMVPSGAEAFAIYFLVCVVCLTCAWLMSLLTERNTSKVRRWMSDVVLGLRGKSSRVGQDV